ncbi:hypothetical protein XENTR_v10002700 [Xenopus tropicalis]|nr:hypothetical protein XENTR_v10002700 [Xenopus tropicalis]
MTGKGAAEDLAWRRGKQNRWWQKGRARDMMEGKWVKRKSENVENGTATKKSAEGIKEIAQEKVYERKQYRENVMK